MSKIDQTFREQTIKILEEGKDYTNVRRGVTRKQVPSYTFRHDFEYGFPALSIKKLKFKDVVGELIWFLRGDNNTKYLYDNDIKIWDKDALNQYNKEMKVEAFFLGIDYKDVTLKEFRDKVKYYSVGQNYSVQYRCYGEEIDGEEIDQVNNLIKGLIKDIMGSRLIVEAWNPLEIDKTALPPCHKGYQVIGVPLENDEFGFELHWNQRSSDWFLGVPFNIASYAILGKILELITGFKCLSIQGDLKCVHLYENQIDPAKELIERDINKHPNCELKISDKLKELCKKYDGDIDKIFNNMNIEDFELVGYTSYPQIKVPMLAPKSI